MHKLLTIDPGSSAFGWAYWTGSAAPEITGVSYFKNKSWLKNLREGQAELTELNEHFSPKLVVCEMPFYGGANAKAQATAASGSLVKLCMSVGVIVAVFPNLRFAAVADWRGQLQDPQVIQRVKARIPGANYKSHAWDAVGIGLWHLTGRL